MTAESFLLSLVLVNFISGAVSTSCPQVTTVTNFQPKRYLGRWLEQQRVPREFEAGTTCATADYSNGPDNTIIVHNRSYRPSLKRYTSVTGSARFAGSPDTAKLLVSFPESNGREADYWVLGTDYDNFSVVWSCRPTADGPPKVSIWVLSRGEQLSPDSWREVRRLLVETGADLSALENTNRTCPETSCPRWPISEPQLSVDRISGRWLELRRGSLGVSVNDVTSQSCGTFRMSSVPAGLQIAYDAYDNRTQQDVRNELTAAWENITSKEGVFSLQGQAEKSGELWILSTDYDNYALVAICYMRGTDFPMTGEVKLLSRTRPLTPATAFAVNAVLVSAGLTSSTLQDMPPEPCPEPSRASNGVNGNLALAGIAIPLIISLLRQCP